MRTAAWGFVLKNAQSNDRIAPARKQDRDRELRLFIESIKKQPLVLEVWSERLWVGLLEKATVFHDGRMVFQFKNGTEIEVEL